MKKIPLSFFALILTLVAVFCSVSIVKNSNKAEAAVITEEWFTGEIPEWKYATATMPSESTDVSTTPSTWYDESTCATTRVYEELTTSPSTTVYDGSTTTKYYPLSTTTTVVYDDLTTSPSTTAYDGSTTTKYYPLSTTTTVVDEYITTTATTTEKTTTTTAAPQSTTKGFSIPSHDNDGYTEYYMYKYEETTWPVRHTVPTDAYNEEEISGSWNENVLTETNGKITWIFDVSTGVMRIEGSGEIPRRNLNYGNFDTLNKIIIGDGITGIDDSCFSRMMNLTDVVISDSVESIGNYAFAWCSNLKNVTLGKNLVSLGIQSFENCSSLEKIEIPDSVEAIGFSTFIDCQNLESVVLGESIKEIGDLAFYSCSSLKEIVLPDSVESIGKDAFYGCSSLEKVQFGNKIKTIEEEAFKTCISLYEISIPDSVESIGVYAFNGCLNLKKISIGNGVKSIGRQAFVDTAYYWNRDNWEDGVLYIDNCLIKASYSVSDDYRIKEGTKVVSGYAFSNATNLNSVYIPEGVVGIGNGAFKELRIESVDIPESVEIIGPLAFSGLRLNTELTISENVKEIGAGAFWGCNITGFIVDENNPYFVNDEYGVIYTKDMKTVVAFPDDCPITDYTIKDGTEEIADFAFARSKLQNITIPATVEKIGFAAFASSWQLSELIIPDAVKELEPYAAYGLSLKLFDTGDGVEYFNVEVFSSRSTIDCMKIGKSVRSIPSTPTKVTKYEVDPENPYFSSDDDGVVYNKDKTTIVKFPGNSSIENYVMPSSVKHTRGDAFGSCENLKSITFSESFDAWEEKFQDRFHIRIETEKYIVPEGNPYYSSDENGVLFSKDKTTLISYPSKNTSTSYTVPDGVETIGEYAFYNCDNLKQITVPDSVNAIPSFTFFCCDKLTEVILPEKPMDIGFNAFAGSAIENDSSNWENGCFYVGNHLICVNAEETSGIVCLREGTIDIAQSAFRNTYAVSGVYIPKSVKYISEGAFFSFNWGYVDLQNIYYPGSSTEWEAIDIVYHGNEPLWGAVINCHTIDVPPAPDPAPETIVDKDTGVSVEIDSSKYGGEVEIIVEKNIDDNSAFDIITTETDVEDFALYDITMTLDGKEIQPREWVTVRLPLPENFDASRSMVFYVNTETGNVERMNARFEDGYMVFETDHFSYYAIVEESITPTEPTVAFNHGNVALYYKHSGSVSAVASEGKVIYTSSAPDIVSVDVNGNITAQKTGTAVITATVEGTDVSASCKVTVTYAWWQWIIRILLLGFLWY